MNVLVSGKRERDAAESSHLHRDGGVCVVENQET